LSKNLFLHMFSKIKKIFFKISNPDIFAGYFLKAFTLVEVLVVIAIIGILAGIIIVSINPSRQFAQARNTQRQSDITVILNAVNQYFADTKGGVPATITTNPTIICKTNDTSCVGLIDLSVLTNQATYLTALPIDPLCSADCNLTLGNIFSDNFNRSNSTNLGSDWTERDADWGILLNSLKINVGAVFTSAQIVSNTIPSTANYTVQSTLNFSSTADGRMGIGGRQVNFGASTDSDAYFLYIRPADFNMFELYKRISGVSTLLGAFLIPGGVLVNTNYIIKLEMNGTTIKGYLNGIERISVVDSGLVAAGRGMIIKEGSGIADVTWDGFSMYTIGGEVITSTGYKISKDVNNGRITITAPVAELGATISLIR